MGNKPSIVLFLSRFGSLDRWRKDGILSREMALYERIRDAGIRVGIVSYGGNADQELAASYQGIEVLNNRWGIPARLYEAVLPRLHASSLRKYHVTKTNQMNGAAVALRSARLARSQLLARMGYMWSKFEESANGKYSARTVRARIVEGRVWSAAARIVVTTPQMAESVIRRNDRLSQRIVTIPNFIDTELFRPPSRPESSDPRVYYVGRFSSQKNVEALLQAARIGDWSLVLIGSGDSKARMQSRYEDLGKRISWLPQTTHGALSGIMSREIDILVLPSHYEGHPKVLLEAMAAGVAVIGANSSGIREIIRHRETGLLCEPTPEAINAAVMELRVDKALRERLGNAARREIVSNYSIDVIVAKEVALIEQVVSRLKSERR